MSGIGGYLISAVNEQQRERERPLEVMGAGGDTKRALSRANGRNDG